MNNHPLMRKERIEICMIPGTRDPEQESVDGELAPEA
jgi:hypothetical protein